MAVLDCMKNRGQDHTEKSQKIRFWDSKLKEDLQCQINISFSERQILNKSLLQVPKHDSLTKS